MQDLRTDQLLKNIPHTETLDLNSLVEYEEGRVVSRTFSAQPTVNITLFSFWEGEGISAHSAPGDAMVQVLDGEAAITIGEQTFSVTAGQTIVMPAGIPHGLEAIKRFKMLLTVVKPPKQ